MNRYERRQAKKREQSFEQLEARSPVSTQTAAVERAFLYREPTLEAIDADYKMRQLQPRISIREGWRFVY